MGELGTRLIEDGREAYDRRDWATAFDKLSAADRQSSLSPEDLEKAAMAAHLAGYDRDSAAFWQRGHHAYAETGGGAPAIRCAFWLSLLALMIDGDPARSSGWQSRGMRLLDERGLDVVERGYLLILSAIRCLFEGDFEGALAGFQQVAGYGERFHDHDLQTVCRLGTGQAKVRLGQIAEGMALLDEVMVDVTAGDITPVFAGVAYCAVIEECQLVFDVHRAHAWTEALNRWSAAQPGLVPYRRQCLAHRAEILLFHGAWTEAQAEASRACQMVSQVADHFATGEGWYVRGEVHRLRGESSMAEEAYREASRLGRTVNPGMARLRLMQGQGEAAASSLRRELEETAESRPRSMLLDALVEVLLAVGETDEAASAADALAGLARDLDTALPDALALRARGAVALAKGEAGAALVDLRQAWRRWYDLEAPYEAARVRVLIGLCCRALGDRDSADLELDAAEQIFAQLGARPDLERLAGLRGRAGVATDHHGLTERELEVLRLVVAGNTNHAIATRLVLSDHTVRRHVQNIFAKLGVSSRAAATAYALQHDLL